MTAVPGHPRGNECQGDVRWVPGETVVPGDATTGDPMCGAYGGHETGGDGTYCTLPPHPETVTHRFEVP